MSQHDITDLKSFAQTFQAGNTLGGAAPRDASQNEVFLHLQRMTDRNFYAYLGVTAGLFLTVLVLAFIFRDSLGNMGIVLGGGGALLAGILRLLGSAWAKKSEIALISILIEGLPEDQFGVILGVIARKK
jgi:hypothetical protein